ncbi:uncharacterized protein LOC141916963 [Strix aluco]|uniref:uncharacterized protein LOC141916963 n=1 Tax=Strix aluco TaxID=111821 RepID=UPI003DA2A897
MEGGFWELGGQRGGSLGGGEGTWGLQSGRRLGGVQKGLGGLQRGPQRNPKSTSSSCSRNTPWRPCSTPAPWSKQPNTSSPALPPPHGESRMDLSMSEEDQMMHAVAMSLGQDIPMDQRAESPEGLGGDTGFQMGLPKPACHKEEECRAHERQEEAAAKCLEKFEGAEPLEVAELLAFTDSMLLGCSQLLDELPDTVYRVCDLITTAIKCNGAAYRDSVLKQVVKQVWEAATSSSRRRCHSPPATPKRCRNGSAKWRLCLKPPTWPCGSFSQPTPS